MAAAIVREFVIIYPRAIGKHEKVIARAYVGILIGTDFNPDGFERVGPKTAMKMIKQHKRLEDIPQIQEQLNKIPFDQIRKIFLEPDVSKIDKIEFGEPDYEGIVKYLSEERDFSKDRVETSLNRLKKSLEKKSQTLEQWFT